MAGKFYAVKDEVRIVGFDDGPFRRGDKDVLVVGSVFRGGLWTDGIMSCRVSVDGLDATDKISNLMKKCRFKDVRVIMIDGIAFGGFNIVDINRLAEETHLAVIAVTRDMPDFAAIKNALKHLSEPDLRWSLIERAGTPVAAESREGKSVVIQHAGIGLEDARSIVKVAATRSLLPEPIRVSHLIAQGIVSGQSKGKA
jgi:uncharacterized protein